MPIKANGSLDGAIPSGFENDMSANGSPPRTSAIGVAAAFGLNDDGLLNIAVYENGAGFGAAPFVSRAGAIVTSGIAAPILPIPEPPFPAATFCCCCCCFNGADDLPPNAPPSKSPNTSSLLDGLYPGIPADASLDAVDRPQPFPDTSAPPLIPCDPVWFVKLLTPLTLPTCGLALP